MKRKVRLSEKLLLIGFSFILLFMVIHDWVPLGSLNDVEAIAADRSVSELLIVTFIGVAQILLLMGFVLFFMGKNIQFGLNYGSLFIRFSFLQAQYSIGGFLILRDMVLKKG